MTLSRRSTIRAIGVVGTGSALAGTALAVNEHEDDERDAEDAPSDDEEVGAIRVGHFSPDAPNVDVYVDGQQILSDVGYDELSPYLRIVPGTYSIAITAAGDDEPIHEGTIVVDSEFYTAAAIGELEGEGDGDEGVGDESGLEDAGNETAAGEGDAPGNESDEGDAPESDAETDADDAGTFDVLLLVDSQADDAEEGTTPFRFVHAVPDAPTVDVADGETGALIFEDVGFTEPSGYVPIDPGTRTLDIFPADEDDLGGDPEDDADGADNDTDAAENDTDGGNQTVTFGGDNESDGDDDTDEDNDTAGEVDVITQPDPVASVELELEADTAYTAFAIGYLEEQDEEEVTIDEEEFATDDEFGEDDADDADDDRSFSVSVAVDGEMSEETDAEDERGVEDDDLEPDGESPAEANESADDAPGEQGNESGGGNDPLTDEANDTEPNDTDGYSVDEPSAADD